MKKLISVLLCVIMLVSMMPASYAANKKTADHSDIFNAVVKALDKEKIDYEIDEDREPDQDEHIEVTITDKYLKDLENWESIIFDVYVNEEYNRLQILCFYVIEYDEKITDEDYFDLLETVNYLNYDYNYVKFYTDEDYCSVDAEFSSYVRKDSAGEIAIDMLTIFSYIVDEAYGEELADFDINT